jgi:hypothetical protein
MSNTMSDTTTVRPTWATEMTEPVVTEESRGYHTTEVTVGDFGVTLNQWIHADGTSEPVHADLEEFGTPGDWLTACSAQQCRDLASALLKAATIIDDNNA